MNLNLFPQGFVSVPGADFKENFNLREVFVASCKNDGFSGFDLCFRPLILFPRLPPRDGWRNDKPSAELIDSYLAQLHDVVSALNSASIAHLDMRPANIMWRGSNNKNSSSSSCVEFRLMDIEYAEYFDYVIPPGFVTTVVHNSDSRYPFKEGDEKLTQFAKKLHNDFFLEAVSQWVASESADFGEFMREKGAEIGCKRKPV